MIEFGTLYNESNIDTLHRVESDFINLTITSPQYNIDLGNGNNGGVGYDSSIDNKDYSQYIDELRYFFLLLFNKTAIGGRCVINIGDQKNGAIPVSSDVIQFMKEIGWLPYTHIIWNKKQCNPRTAWGSWLSPKQPSFPTPFEHILVFSKASLNLNRIGVSDLNKEEFVKFSLSMWEFSGVHKRQTGHPASFPEELPYRCIKMLSYIDDIIYDPYAGIGTTLSVAKKLNRRCFGSEISTTYCNIYNKKSNDIIRTK